MSLVKDEDGNVLNPTPIKHRYGADGMTLDWFDTHPRPLPEIMVPQHVIDHLAKDPTYPKGIVKLIPTPKVDPIPLVKNDPRLASFVVKTDGEYPFLGTVTNETPAPKLEEVAVKDSENLPI